MRWLTIAFGVVLTISIIPFGDWLHDGAVVGVVSEDGEKAGIVVLAILMGIVSTVIGFASCIVIVLEIVNDGYRALGLNNAVGAIMSAFFLTNLYSILQGPLAADEVNLIGPWVWLAILGFAPVFLFVGELLLRDSSK